MGVHQWGPLVARCGDPSFFTPHYFRYCQECGIAGPDEEPPDPPPEIPYYGMWEGCGYADTKTCEEALAKKVANDVRMQDILRKHGGLTREAWMEMME